MFTATHDRDQHGPLPVCLRQFVAHEMHLSDDRRAVLESPRRTPVAAEVDVLVCGGGPAGIGAVLAAAREGRRVLVLERQQMLGGVWTAGLLNPLFDSATKGWIVSEIVRRLREEGAWREWHGVGTFDFEAMKYLLERMAVDAGAQIWYGVVVADTIVQNGQVIGVIVEGKAGRQAVLAKVVIDSTGDGDVAARAGLPFNVGRDSDGLVQPLTLMFEVEGVESFVQNGSIELYDKLAKAIADHQLATKLPFNRVNYAPWIIHVPRPGSAVVQATHAYGIDPLDPPAMTRAMLDLRRQANDLAQVMRHVPGLANLHLTQTAPAVGVREARRIVGHHTLTLDDLRVGRRFEDAVTFGTFNVDIHRLEPGGAESKSHCTPIQPYEIPYRCLLPADIQGLIVAGRCISGTHEAHASYRVTGTCCAVGQAAGLAASMAVVAGRLPSQVDGRDLRHALVDRGAAMLPAV